jgi:D-alanyl-D-alanine carboxypeptidase
MTHSSYSQWSLILRPDVVHFKHIASRRNYFLTIKKREDILFDDAVLARKNIGQFYSLAIRLNRANNFFSGNELHELQYSKAYSVPSFNSTIPDGKKNTEKIIKSAARGIKKQIVTNRSCAAVTCMCTAAFFFAVGCFAQKAPHPASEQARIQSGQLVSSAALSADEQKLRVPLASLSQAAQAGIADGSAAEFLRDLNVVLAADAVLGEDGFLRLVDKQHALPQGYAPRDIVPLVKNGAYGISRNDLSLRTLAERALREMALAAQKDGAYLAASSSYRSYEYQVQVYERNVRLMGKTAADRESAQPGKSQHQLGTVIDFGSITDDFVETKEGKWLAARAGEYGWSLSFPDGYEEVTGYRWECWHYRYIGIEAARFQKKWFSDIQQFMLEFIHAWQSQ